LVIKGFGLNLRALPYQFWKMPELFEFVLDLFPARVDTLRDVMPQAPQGWVVLSKYQDRSAVWNQSSGMVFLIPEVRWAELNLADPALRASSDSRREALTCEHPLL
jgi:hypothetical protein